MIAETEDDLIKRFNEWKDYVENRGIKVHTTVFTALWNLSGTTRVSRYRKKHSPTHTNLKFNNKKIILLYIATV